MRRDAQAQFALHCLDRAKVLLDKKNPALAADFAMRGLNVSKKNVDLLQIAASVANVLGQSDMAKHCAEELTKLGQPPSFFGTQPLSSLPIDWDGYEEISVTSNVGRDDLIGLQTIDGYGRGLVATGRVTKGTVLLTEEPWLVQPSSRQVCSHCLSSEWSGSFVCDQCGEVYCSESCRTKALEGYHGPMCGNALYQEYDKTCARSLEASDGEKSHSQSVSSTCRLIGRICAKATVVGSHPLALPEVVRLSGYVKYLSGSVFEHVSSLSLDLAAALRQPMLFLDDFMRLYAVIQMNEVTSREGVRLYSSISLLNHSCVPNAIVVRHRTVVAVRDIPQGEQIFIDYNPEISSRPYSDRRKIHEQRGFQCRCQRCVMKQ